MQTIRLATFGGIIGAVLILVVPALSGEWLQKLLARIPLVGPTAARLVGAVATFRDEKRYIFTAAAISVCSNSLFILSFYFVARGLPVHAASLAEHFVIVPIANLAGAIPATPSGLGTMELAVEKLYLAVSQEGARHPGDGTLVALGQRADDDRRRRRVPGVLPRPARRPPRSDAGSRGSRRSGRVRGPAVAPAVASLSEAGDDVAPTLARRASEAERHTLPR